MYAHLRYKRRSTCLGAASGSWSRPCSCTSRPPISLFLICIGYCMATALLLHGYCNRLPRSHEEGWQASRSYRRCLWAITDGGTSQSLHSGPLLCGNCQLQRVLIACCKGGRARAHFLQANADITLHDYIIMVVWIWIRPLSGKPLVVFLRHICMNVILAQGRMLNLNTLPKGINSGTTWCLVYQQVLPIPHCWHAVGMGLALDLVWVLAYIPKPPKKGKCQLSCQQHLSERISTFLRLQA